MKKIATIAVSFIALVILALSVVGIAAGDAVAIPRGFAGGYTDVDGVRLRYVQQGKGSDILLVHGTPSSLEEWDPVIDRLAQKHRVTAYDRPGQGFSGPSPWGYDLAYNAKIARDLITKLDLKDVTVAGHSYGGAVALQMAIRDYPGIRAYVVAGSTAYYPSEEKPGTLNTLLRLPLIGKGIAVLLKKPGGSMVEAGVKKAFHPNESSMPGGLVERKKALWLQPRVLVASAWENANYERDKALMIPRFGRITRRVYLVYGKNDRVPTVRSARKLAEVIPGSELTLLDDTGHMIQYARPDELVKVIEKAVTRPGRR